MSIKALATPDFSSITAVDFVCNAVPIFIVSMLTAASIPPANAASPGVAPRFFASSTAPPYATTGISSGPTPGTNAVAKVPNPAGKARPASLNAC